jgi:hypothetical protein
MTLLLISIPVCNRTGQSTTSVKASFLAASNARATASVSSNKPSHATHSLIDLLTIAGLVLGGLAAAPLIVTAAVLGVPSVAVPDGVNSSIVKILLPANGFEFAIGTTKVLFALSPFFQLNVPLLDV